MAIKKEDIYWIAGFLEGEGSFVRKKNCCQCQAGQVQIEPLERIKNLLGGKVYTQKKSSGPRKQIFSKWEIQGQRAVGVMMTIFQIMSPRRKGQILKALNVWRVSQVGNKYKNACKFGHPFSQENKIIDKQGNRHCRICQKKHKRRQVISRKERGLSTGGRKHKKGRLPSKNQLSFSFI